MADGLDTPALEAWIKEFARTIAEHKEELTALDSAIGDADHGTNMDRGMSAAVAALDATPPADPAALLKQVGMTLVSKVGGASGPLYGTFFLRMAGAVGSDPADAETFARAFRAGLDGVVARGKAEPGDKTMLDALVPACDSLDAAVAAGQHLPGELDRGLGQRAAVRDDHEAHSRHRRQLPASVAAAASSSSVVEVAPGS